MKRFMNKKVATIGLAAGLALGAAGAAFAYFSTSGSGQGTGTVGSNSALAINQNSITYSNALTDDALLPGTSATVTFTVDNNSSGNQELGTISVSSISADSAHAGCDTATNPSWFTTTTDAVNHDYSPGTGQAVTGSITITFNDLTTVAQDVCKGATLTFHYAA